MHMLDYMQAKRVLDRYGIKSIEGRYVGSADEAIRFAAGKGVVLKLISGKAVHKTKEGLVKLDLKEKDEIRRAYGELVAKGRRFRPYRVLVQRMARGGVR